MFVFVDCVLLVVLSHWFCLWPAVLYMYWNCLFDNLQENVDTVTPEKFENAGEEDWIKIKTEQHYIQLVRTLKGEQEVSVLCSEY